jgi:hypothetical protein
LISWIKTGGGQLSSPLTFSNVRKQILWGNRFITFEKKINYKEWIPTDQNIFVKFGDIM